MKRSMRICAALVVLSFATLAGAPAASATGAPHGNLSWASARVVINEKGAWFTSISPCPDRHEDGTPIQGTREVFVLVLFSFGGGMGQGPIAVNPDGSWSGELRFLVSPDVHDRDATVIAECDDVTFTGIPLGKYRPHHITVNPG